MQVTFVDHNWKLSVLKIINVDIKFTLDQKKFLGVPLWIEQCHLCEEGLLKLRINHFLFTYIKSPCNNFHCRICLNFANKIDIISFPVDSYIILSNIYFAKVIMQVKLIGVAYTLRTHWNQFSLGGHCKQEYMHQCSFIIRGG